MKILITIFEINDYGGIVSGVENLIKGFQEHGHTCVLLILRANDQDGYVRKMEGPKGSYPSITGGVVHVLSGWYGVRVMSYGTPARVKAWQQYANGFDLVVHEIPCPKPDAAGMWKKVYDIHPAQIVIVHDAHFRDMYPHLALVASKIRGVTCTNHAGYASLSWLPVPRAFIGAPHIPLDWNNLARWHVRPMRAVCAHVWKAWKHMDTVVRAAPYIDSHLVMGGDGIEGRYMRSIDKCKPKYEGIWKAAFGNKRKAEYVGVMTSDTLFTLYQNARVMVDMSYSKKFAALGNHFNRSLIESYNNGVVPICVEENMTDATPAQRTLWKADGPECNYIAVPKDIAPKQLAEVIDSVVNMRRASAEDIISNGRKILLRHFDYRNCAEEMLKLARGRPCGIYPKLETGVMPKGFAKVIADHIHVHKILEEFNVKEK